MGWDAFIVGELVFPAGALERWRASPATVADVAWPRMIAQGIIEPDDEGDEADDDERTVDDTLRLSTKLNHYFGAIDVDGNAVRIAFYVDNSNYWMVCEPVVRVTSAAALAGATGRVRFLDTGDAIVANRFNGALITIGDGAIVATEGADAALTADDVAQIRTSVDDAIARAGRVAAATKTTKAKVKAKPKAKAKAKPKPKPKAKPKPRR
jgi:hypothetical protein